MKKIRICKTIISVMLGGVILFSASACGKNEVTEPSDATMATESVEIVTEPVGPLFGKVIVVDPGHGVTSFSKKEYIAPDSKEMKPAYVSGTRGINQTEEQLNLSVAFKLKEALEKHGAEVYMTREVHECEVSNIDRAVFANELNANISVKLHADGNNNSGVHGVSVLVPGNTYIKNEYLIQESRRAGELVLDEFVKATGAKNRGISVRNDMTGFNWSKVPVILVEMGFMTNPMEDALMEAEEYQYKMVDGIVNGLIIYFE